MNGDSLLLHPEDEQLLRYLDGELPARTSDELRSHLEACWQCRAALGELQSVVTECVHYRKNVLQRHLPAPPAPWLDIYRQFDEIDASMEPVLFDRIRRFLKSPFDNAARRWAVAAAALLIVIALAYRYRQAPSVQAAELLRKAVAAANTHPERARRIQIRTKDHRYTRPAVMPQRTVSPDTSSAATNSLEAMFVRANYNWEDPLSAASFQAWHDRLGSKQDAVIEEDRAYRIETRTDSNELRHASLTLRTLSLEPVEERLEFSDQTWVEITEITAEPAVPERSIAAGSLPRPSIPRAPATDGSNREPSSPAASATIGDELHVMTLLHDAGADLGEPVAVSRSGGEIIVNGVGIAPQRQREIRAALGSTANVVVRFAESPPVDVQRQRIAPGDSTPGADVRQLQARIADLVGGRANLDQLAAQVLDADESLMARAYALRRLAEQFPSQAESEMSVTDRQLLRRLRDEHAAELRKQTAEIERDLQPVLAWVVASTGSEPVGTNPADPWQLATEGLFQSARKLDKLVAVMFGATPSDTAGDQVPAQLKSSLAQLRARLDAYQRSNR